MTTINGIMRVEKLKNNGWKCCGGTSNHNDLITWKNFKKKNGLPEDLILKKKDHCICGHEIINQCYIYKVKNKKDEDLYYFKVLGTECIKKVYNEEYKHLRSENRKECPICNTIHGSRKRTDLCPECCDKRCEKCYKILNNNKYKYCYNCK